ncbi:DUF1491 family protein [Microbaculum marinisediminis]|uniref:DUF1491 family protein n=1 Tax=Microbaculum marinisediminis TaxID=2931392 RepID=A0AAW5QVL4_9HYPH|nr:DUF1491 family protein [Microbaculum sp. A6E488]MCT8971242.1 DUF1491 family protein [Microbaculum sp. A6E488]
MRLKSAIWVSAYVRRLSAEGIPVAVMRRGAEEAGAIFIKINRLDGTADVYGPAPQTAFEDDRPVERLWSRATGAEPVEDAKAEEYLARQRRFDPDLWVVEVEERTGRHLLEQVVDGL